MKVKVNHKAMKIAIIDSGLNSRALAEKAHISNTTAWKIMHCEREVTSEVLYKIGKALGVKPSSLAVIDDDE